MSRRTQTETLRTTAAAVMVRVTGGCAQKASIADILEGWQTEREGKRLFVMEGELLSCELQQRWKDHFMTENGGS